MTDHLRPLLSGDRYTDTELEFALAGRCGYEIDPGKDWCGEISDPDSPYRHCAEHDAQVRDWYPESWARDDAETRAAMT